MSVRLGERKTSNLKYIQDAQILCAYTFKMCKNPNHFPEPVLAANIKQESLEILKNVRYYLASYTYNKNDKTILLQHRANILTHIDALYALLELAYNDDTYKIEPKSMEYWIGLIVNLEESIGSVPIC